MNATTFVVERPEFICDKKELWQKILVRLQPLINRAHFITWFKNTAILSIENDSFVIGLPKLMFLRWHLENYQNKILSIAQEFLPNLKELSYEIDESLDYTDNCSSVDLENITTKLKQIRKLPNKEEVRIRNEGEADLISKIISSRYTLNNFIVSPENRVAHASCEAVSRRPGALYNPLFIYGGVGLGKTHLLQATGREILKNFPDKSVVYLTSETFAQEYIDYVKKHRVEDFKKKYRSADVLIVDDIQFLANREGTQTEFFNTFNTLYDAGKQIIISSDKPPKELDLFMDRLKSRFEMGLTTEVQFSDFETRLLILQNKCSERNLLLAPEILEFIALNVQYSIRELEGMLMQAEAQYDLENITPTINSLATQLNKLNKKHELIGYNENDKEEKRISSPQEIIEIVCGYYEISQTDILGPARQKFFSSARQMSMYLMKKILKMSYVEIGKLFNRTHTTIMHACDSIERLSKNEEKVVEDLNALQKKMGL